MRAMRFVWLVLPAGILFGAIGAANAQGSDAARQACTPDAMRLCQEFIPDAARVKSCMLRKRGQWSAACRAAMAGGGRHAARGHHRHYTRHRHHR